MPLIWRRVSETKFEAVAGRLVVGAVYKEVLSGGQVHWSWHLSAVTAPQPGVHERGRVANVDVAKAALELNWRVWLTLVGLRE